ncbi:MAG: DUF4912 domain-containing protein [Nitrospirae bacterium]|nr:MAG: DUF4912 domain-containing protein [Nitrospirota bacterium]
MTKKELAEKDIKELRSLAKKAGITAKRDWTKTTFAEALFRKSAKPAAKKTTKKIVDKKKAPDRAKKTKPKNGPKTRPKAKPETKKDGKKSKTSVTKKTTTKKAPEPRKKKVVRKELKPAISKRPAVKKTTKKSLPKRDENIVMVMTVSPERIYAYWEISEESFSKHEGSLYLKVIDIKSKDSFLVPVSDRVDEHFIAVRPGGFYVVEIGAVGKNGFFSAIESSPRPQLPAHFTSPTGTSSISSASPTSTSSRHIRKRRIARVAADGSIVFSETEQDLPAFDFPDELQPFGSY